jgi:7-carboxy-7-deazaguanine synthase
MAQKEEGQKIPVIEIFGPTFQGEGALCGHQTWFIRFGGCDYKCEKCDSMHAVDGESIQKLATYMTQEEIILELIQRMGNSSVGLLTFSGGNPCLWELGEVVKALQNMGVVVSLETQGTYYKDWVEQCGVVNVSPKGPGMGEKFEKDKFIEFMSHLKDHRGTSVKIVIFDQRDIEFALMVQEILAVTMPNPVPVFISLGNPYPPGVAQPDGPCLDNSPTDNLRLSLLNQMAILADELLHDKRCNKLTFLPQMHVLLWGNKAGV